MPSAELVREDHVCSLLLTWLLQQVRRSSQQLGHAPEFECDAGVLRRVRLWIPDLHAYHKASLCPCPYKR